MNTRRLPTGLGREPMVVASLGDFSHLLTDAHRAEAEGANLVEVRADLFPKTQLKPILLQRALKKLKKSVKCRLLLTLRMGEEGGGLSPKFREQDRLALFRAGLSEADGVDVELAAVDINRHVVFEAHKRGRFVVLSAHHFKKIPSKQVLTGLVRKFRRFEGDVLKVAVKVSSKSEAAHLMEICSKCPVPRKVFIPMGSKGQEARLNGFSSGTCLTYGYVRKALAPGQLSVKAIVSSISQYKIAKK